MKINPEILKACGFGKVNGRAADGADRWVYDGPPYTVINHYTDHDDKNQTIEEAIEQLTEEALSYFEAKM